jgi:hypothetical protein
VRGIENARTSGSRQCRERLKKAFLSRRVGVASSDAKKGDEKLRDVRGRARTASADLGTPFMPPVGFFLVRTTVGHVMGGREVRSGSRGTGRGAAEGQP